MQEMSDAKRYGTESAQLTDIQMTTGRAGATGKGYVTGFTKDTSAVTWTIPAKAGLYRVRIRFATPGGEKGYTLGVNGAKSGGMFPSVGDKWEWQDAGLVELNDGANHIAIEKGWGYYDIDAIEIAPAKPIPAPKPIAPVLVNRASSPSTKALMRLLCAEYGKSTLSGQYTKGDNDFVKAKTGQLPAFFGDDLSDFSPTRREFGADPSGVLPRITEAVQNGQIPTLCWHWNAPSGLLNKKFTNAAGREVNALWWRGFYTEASTFDIEKTLANPMGDDYKLLLRDIDAVANPLQQLARLDIPILWRPLHEAEGTWFWWGAKGAEPLKALWRLLYQRLTVTHKLNNLIWTFTGEKSDWYPGDDVVDIVGTDIYTDLADPMTKSWESLLTRFDGKKLVALTECGGVPDLQKMRRFGVHWSHFVSWSGDLSARKNDAASLRRIYNEPPTKNAAQITGWR